MGQEVSLSFTIAGIDCDGQFFLHDLPAGRFTLQVGKSETFAIANDTIELRGSTRGVVLHLVPR